MKAKSAVSSEVSQVLLDGRAVDITLRDGRIAAIRPTGKPARQVILPLTVDPHVHLDKTFTAGRCDVREPGLFGAIDAMARDTVNWTETDLRQRMGAALQEAYANGTTALRSHIDWTGAATPLAWSVLGELAQEWRGRMVIQRASLISLDDLADPETGAAIAAQVARDGGVLGAFVYRNADIDAALAWVFDLAARHDLSLDFHVDEGLEPEADGFNRIVALTGARGMAGRVLCGHACSLSLRHGDGLAATLDAAAEAGVALTVMPTTNLWLQDSRAGITPRQRGLAPLHEARAAGVPVLLGADNVADPFYPMGTYDALDVLRLASTAAHLAPADWLGAITAAPARALGLDAPAIAVGQPADFILLDGATWDGALRSPTAPRRIVRAGQTLVKKEAA